MYIPRCINALKGIPLVKTLDITFSIYVVGRCLPIVTITFGRTLDGIIPPDRKEQIRVNPNTKNIELPVSSKILEEKYVRRLTNIIITAAAPKECCIFILNGL